MKNATPFHRDCEEAGRRALHVLELGAITREIASPPM
jgi:hypothetical protein